MKYYKKTSIILYNYFCNCKLSFFNSKQNGIKTEWNHSVGHRASIFSLLSYCQISARCIKSLLTKGFGDQNFDYAF